MAQHAPRNIGWLRPQREAHAHFLAPLLDHEILQPKDLTRVSHRPVELVSDGANVANLPLIGPRLQVSYSGELFHLAATMAEYDTDGRWRRDLLRLKVIKVVKEEDLLPLVKLAAILRVQSILPKRQY